MTQELAVQAATLALPRFDVPSSYRFTDARRCILEIVAGHLPQGDELPPPGPVLDRIAWLVTFMMDPWTVEFAVDDQDGRILRFRRSRGGALAGPRGQDASS